MVERSLSMGEAGGSMPSISIPFVIRMKAEMFYVFGVAKDTFSATGIMSISSSLWDEGSSFTTLSREDWERFKHK